MTKRLDYPTVKALFDAGRLINDYPHSMGYVHIPIVKQGDRTYEVNTNYSWVVYSQQETVIHRPRWLGRPTESTEESINYFLPEGVEMRIYSRPRKDYVCYPDKGGVTRYAVIPEEGLRLHRDGGGYKAMNAPPDYRIEVDRAKAKIARESLEDLIDYLRGLWDLVDKPDTRVWHRPKQIPPVDDRESWFAFLQQTKFAQVDSIGLETLLTHIRSQCTEAALAYRVMLVPNTKTDITEHYGKLEKLRAAGMLERFEGKPKKKKGKK